MKKVKYFIQNKSSSQYETLEEGRRKSVMVFVYLLRIYCNLLITAKARRYVDIQCVLNILSILHFVFTSNLLNFLIL